MTFEELKKEVVSLKLEKYFDKFEGFEESHDDNFKTVYMMMNMPGYTLAQYNDDEMSGTVSTTWFICIPMDDKMCVIDIGTEDEMCEQFFNLLHMITLGFGTIDVRKKERRLNEFIFN